MSDAREGGCQCGAIRYRVEGDPLSVGVCHCRECQRQTGSAFGMSFIVRKEQLQLLAGTPKTFTRSSDSGRPVVCAFCGECGTRIYHVPAWLEGVVNVKAGTFDDPSSVRPTVEIWTARKLPWVEMPAGLHAIEGQP